MPEPINPSLTLSLECCTYTRSLTCFLHLGRHPKIAVHLNCECDPEQRTLEAGGWVVVPTDSVTFHARFLFVSVGCYLNNAGAPVEPTGMMPVVYRCTSEEVRTRGTQVCT